MAWSQITHTFPARSQGSYLVTSEIERAISSELKNYKIGMCNLFLQHTSASLCLNENACRDVREDLTMALNHMVPENLRYKHTDEGPDDMPGHVKSAVMGVSLDIPISNGRLALGTWQGIYLCEHRTYQHRRTVVITLQGEKR
ncbi:hypothetical protein J3B02_002447 [Coemansia erecta]|uniref:Secondary thiamine-phosphate synthase enzyme n=1 Tax=Coemansia asiatica TaxID=1052880 RepID=A0A9W7XHS8_9FUNG|nr:hypothetical protein LPJ64_004704 [Coemansia asiatica]KAJ2854896.1 hypothetical protein J3B02_002447 [Coemansia erecta]KAJ2859723.1 hypothetical protein FB639_005734 [Coemansia asiatica]